MPRSHDGEIQYWRERAEQAERERDEYRKALHSLLLEAECYAGMSKHLMRECEEVRRVLENNPQSQE